MLRQYIDALLRASRRLEEASWEIGSARNQMEQSLAGAELSGLRAAYADPPMERYEEASFRFRAVTDGVCRFDCELREQSRTTYSRSLRLMQALKEQGSRIPVILYASDRAIRRYDAETKALGVYLATNRPGELLSAVSGLLHLDV